MGWKVRRIMKTKEVVIRVRQFRELCEEESKLKKSKAVGNEKAKNDELLDGLYRSKIALIEKLWSLIVKMQNMGLWLTFLSAEDATDSLRTPRTGVQSTIDQSSSKKHEFLRRGTRS